MKYNYSEIGERIRKLRKIAGLNQEDYIETLRGHGVVIARNRLSSIENGVKEAFSLELLIAVCEIHDCDMGFLLGEYTETTRDTHEICEATGLSEKAFRVLCFEKENCRIQKFNSLLINKNFWEIIGYFDTCEKTPEHIRKEKMQYDDLYQRYVQSLLNEDEDEETQKALSTLQFYTDRLVFNYAKDRQKCEILFSKILEKFLPDIK